MKVTEYLKKSLKKSANQKKWVSRTIKIKDELIKQKIINKKEIENKINRGKEAIRYYKKRNYKLVTVYDKYIFSTSERKELWKKTK